MEKELARYKKNLKMQNTIFVAATLILAVLIGLSAAQVINPAFASERWAAGWNGFIFGLSSAVIAFMVLGIVMNVRAMRSEAYLKKQYIKEHDERAQAISRYAGHMSYWFETVGLVLGIVVGGYFRPIISFVCLGCLFYICLVRLGLKIYYSKKL